ncbi:NAD-P-binding protein [Artomyces pyxidatus]|uniref:NAD-P-binding protein n=1 Tax=Artomyces pyxidatus TaxID=48021 RepID=A0ACB8SQH7_9AGAM|nr:NAD-P-binding protein [Artomyces pyxidatus]
MSSQIVLVTGASGFVGSNVVDAVLKAGYTTRAIVRPKRTAAVKAAYAKYGDKFEVAEIEDLATSDLSAAFQGAWAILHVGSPLPDATLPQEELIRTAVDGTKRVLDFAYAAGIKKIVYTSTFGTLFNPSLTWKNGTYTEDDWYTPTREDGLKPDLSTWTVYAIGKTLAEQEVWKFADAHKDYDVTSILPGFILGRFGSGQTIDNLAQGSNKFVYGLMTGGPLFDHGDYLPTFVNIDDVATLQVLALKTGDAGRRKRILAHAGPFVVREVAEYLHRAHPELGPRLPQLDGTAGSVGEYAKLVGKNAKEILGFEQFTGLDETVDQTVAALLEKEGSQ